MTTIPTAEEITRDWGERCPDFEPGCFCCQMWAMHDEIGRLRGVSAGGEKVKVKPLEWRVPSAYGPKDPDPEDIALCADGIAGIYGISRKQSVGMERLLWWTEDPFTWTGYASVNEAKAAAQADYEQRILSALTSLPTDDRKEKGNG